MRNEYPRPDFIRQNWLSLNGEWDFSFENDSIQKILVPYVYQCPKSGINNQQNSKFVKYMRKFNLPSNWQKNNIILHFGAVDYKCRVYINGYFIGDHTGGNTPFKFDITKYLTWECEEITVIAEDFPASETIARGKQFWLDKPKFIWYTNSTGIWQSVWVEPQSDASFEWIHYNSDIDKGQVEISYRLKDNTPLPCTLKWEISLKGETYFKCKLLCREHEDKFTATVFGNHILSGSFHNDGLCWSPENPTLFNVTAKILVNEQVTDSVKSYFGMRKVTVENGMIYLNNHPYYPKLLLDQGYWKESLLTAPDDDAYRQDIQSAKEMGFNGCRKHEKAEDPRFLYWADKLGFLVWEGMASFISYTPSAGAQFMREWMEVIQRDYNHPSIIVWDMLNESWGVPQIYHDKIQQHYSCSLYHLAHSLDATRLVISNDGWEMTETDICAIHSYSHGNNDNPKQKEIFADCLKSWEGIESGKIVSHLPFARGFCYKGQPVILTEFGGISNSSSKKGWGYTNTKNEEDFLSEYERITEAIKDSDVICGFCYTQLTDVQQETNGLLDDMHKFKYNPEKIKGINGLIGRSTI